MKAIRRVASAHCCVIERGIGASLPGIGARPRQERIREEHGSWNRFETAVNCAVVRVGMRRRLGSRWKVFVAGTSVPRNFREREFLFRGSLENRVFQSSSYWKGVSSTRAKKDTIRLFRYDEIITRSRNYSLR